MIPALVAPREGPDWRPASIGEGWTAGPLAPNVSVVANAEPRPLPPDLERIVAGIWDAARRERPALFNGRVFSVDRIGPARLDGHWTEYRRVFAQLRRPDLFARLRLRPLAVNGLVECDDAVLLGRREAGAVYMPGRWQAAPSGNVEDRGDGAALDLLAQLFAELREELGVEPERVDRAVPVAAIEHAGTHVVDVGFLVRVTMPFATVATSHRLTGNREYDALRAVEAEEAARLVDEPDDALLLSARTLLRIRAGRSASD